MAGDGVGDSILGVLIFIYGFITCIVFAFLLDFSVGLATLVIGLLPTTRSLELALSICLILLGLSVLLSTIFRLLIALHYMAKCLIMPVVLVSHILIFTFFISASIHVFQKEHYTNLRFIFIMFANCLVCVSRLIVDALDRYSWETYETVPFGEVWCCSNSGSQSEASSRKPSARQQEDDIESADVLMSNILVS